MKRGRPRLPMLAAGLVVSALSAGLLGCNERDRIFFPSPPSGPFVGGPTVTIDRPSVDTTITAGPGFFVTGRVVDVDGIDTVYFETEGGVSAFPPFIANSDSVRFGLPITTGGLSGSTITVRVFGVDVLGFHGDTAIRHLTIQ
ncbi:MAG TPA: hypothetical protein VFU03_04910 [Gemmatimonadales bacterium]|nr:hypothetical protein [Gemmatimonadales bacterium]